MITVMIMSVTTSAMVTTVGEDKTMSGTVLELVAVQFHGK